MLRIPKWVAVLSVLGAAAPAGNAAWATTTGQLLRMCKANPRSADYRKCMVYLSGIRDAYLFERSLKNDRIKLLCAPTTLSVHQVKQAYLRYLKKHPDYLNYEAASYVYIALIDAYPCKR
jgi:hypothetical protein